MEFHDEIRKEAFKLQNFLSDNGNQKVKELTKDGKNTISFKVKETEDQNQLSELKKFEDFSCENIFHKFSSKLEEFSTYKTANSLKILRKKNLEVDRPFSGNEFH